MSSQFLDLNAPSLLEALDGQPTDLPRGLITPPKRVYELLEKERARHPHEAFARAFERLLNDWTLQHYFEGLGQEVLYRQTPQGPEVLAVGEEEVIALKKTLPPDQQAQLKTWLPS